MWLKRNTWCRGVNEKLHEDEESSGNTQGKAGAISSTLAMPSAAMQPPEVDKTCGVEFHVQSVSMWGERIWAFQNCKTKGCTIKHFPQKVRGQCYLSNKRHKDKGLSPGDEVPTNMMGKVFTKMAWKEEPGMWPAQGLEEHPCRQSKAKWGAANKRLIAALERRMLGRVAEKGGRVLVLLRCILYLNSFEKKWQKAPF